MKHFYDVLRDKQAELRPARYPNPVERTDEGVWVLVMDARGEERTRFIVDDNDYERLVKPHRWHVGGVKYDRVYTSAKIPTGSGNSTVLLARWLVNPPADKEVDHENGNTLDNRRSNLRVATRKQNEENRTGRKPRGTSKYRGVHLDRATGRWRGQVMHNYKPHVSPRFDTEEEAHRWAVAKRAELFTHQEEE